MSKQRDALLRQAAELQQEAVEYDELAANARKRGLFGFAGLLTKVADLSEEAAKRARQKARGERR